MLTCREFDAFMVDWIDGGLALRQRAAFRLHLALCRACRTYLRTYRAAVELGRGAFVQPDQPLREEVPGALVRAILEARRRG